MMTRRLELLVLVLLAQVLGSVHTARILGIYPVPGKSHHALITSLFKEMAARGHEVTVISGLPLEKPIANYTNVQVSIDFSKLLEAAKDGFSFYKDNPFSLMVEVLEIGMKISDITYNDNKVIEIINSHKHYDVLILEDFGNEALAGISYVFDVPLIYFSTGVGFTWTDAFVGNPSCPSYCPNIFSSYSDHMTLQERFYNTLQYLFQEIYRNLFFLPKQDALMRKHLHGVSNLPYLSAINAKTALVLTNSMPGVNYPKPLLPNFIQVGGLHIKSPKPLPQDIKKFLDSAPEGVIYFSMGSFLQSANFPKRSRASFLKAFSNLKQKVLWKFEVDNLPGQPGNVMIKKWLPQNDILAHPNVKAFITHGGILSSQEAISHGVPVVGIPILGDQRLNMKNAVRLGYGLVVDFSNITDISITWALDEIINNPSYRERAQTVSRIFHDQPQTPMERAVYWTEYVIRHKGAPHLRSAAMDLTWYQYLLLDVIAVLLLIVLSTISVIVFLCKKLFGTKKPKTVNIKKKNN